MRKRVLTVFIIISTIILLTGQSAKATLIWEDKGTTVELQADDGTKNISLGFNFSFYGVSYSNVFINSNGSVTFGNGNIVPDNVAFPASQDPAFPPSAYTNELTMAAPLWDDLTTDSADTGRSTTGLYAKVVGSPGSREFIATWNDVGHYNRSTGTYYGSDTFQIVLFEGSNNLRFSYLNLDGVKDPKHVDPKDLNGITIGVNAGDLQGSSPVRDTQLLYGFVPASLLPENESFLFTFNPDYYGTGIGGYNVAPETVYQLYPVPEPSTFALFGIGIVAGFLAKKKFFSELMNLS